MVDFLSDRSALGAEFPLTPSASFIVSVSRGTVISGIFIYLLPVLAGGEAILFAMPLTELIVAVYVVSKMGKYTKQLGAE